VREYYVYIMCNAYRTLYIGVTGDLFARVYEHNNAVVDGFTARYGIDRLVYFESTNDVTEAIEREKRLKRWVRRKKVALIERDNPGGRTCRYRGTNVRILRLRLGSLRMTRSDERPIC